MTELPSVGETVVVKVTKVLDYGAFVELLEYENQKGFVHVSQIASRWVKNVRNFVKENQIRAAQVLSINPAKGHIDLSLTKVSAGAQRAKIEEYKQFKRAQKLIEVLSQEQKKPFDDAWHDVAEPLINNYGSLQKAFNKILIEDQVPSEIPREWSKPLIEIVKKNFEVSKKEVRGIIELSSAASNGVEIIRKALSLIEKETPKNISVDISYTGSGKYMIIVLSHDYKIAEKFLYDATEKAIKFIEGMKGKAKFTEIKAS